MRETKVMRVIFKIPYFETHLSYEGEVIGSDGDYSKIRYQDGYGNIHTTWRETSSLTELK